jgi:hypothetical protein
MRCSTGSPLSLKDAVWAALPFSASRLSVDKVSTDRDNDSGGMYNSRDGGGTYNSPR